MSYSNAGFGNGISVTGDGLGYDTRYTDGYGDGVVSCAYGDGDGEGVGYMYWGITFVNTDLEGAVYYALLAGG